MDFDIWARKSDTEKIYLVETSALRLADAVEIPLYLSNRGLVLNGRAYLGCVQGLPRLTRQANDTRNLSSVPSWGELELNYETGFKPDAANSLTWDELLSEDYTFASRPLTIKLGGAEFAYGDFRTVFSGYLEDVTAVTDTITATVYDKMRFLETREIPGPPVGLIQPPISKGKDWRNFFARIVGVQLPKNNAAVPVGQEGKQLPLIMGLVKNYHPVLINEDTDKFALAAHVVNQVLMAYRNGREKPNFVFRQKDINLVEKEGLGSALLAVTGTYSGGDNFRCWTVEIDSVAAGKEVGQATFKWSLDGGATYEAQGQPTQNLEMTAVTKTPGGEPPSDGALVVGGAYTSQWIRAYRVKITVAGATGIAKFKWSNDGGATWSAELFTAIAPIALEYGLTAAFTGNHDVDDLYSWTFTAIPLPLGDGLSIQFFTQAGDDFELYDAWGWTLCSTLDVPYNADENSVTVDVEGKIAATGVYVETIADLIRDLLVTYLGWDPDADLDLTSFAAFNAAFPHQAGLRVESPASVRQIIDDLLAGLPAYYFVGLDGKFRLGVLTEPAGEPDLTLYLDQESWEPEQNNRASEVVCRVTLNYDRNQAPSDDYKGSDKAWTEWARKEWREAEDRDETVRDLYPLAAPLEAIDTCLMVKADAEAAAGQMLALWSTERRPLTTTCKVQPFALDLWALVRVIGPRYGLAEGKLFWLTGMDLDFIQNEAELTLWR